jgi:hypothetical protein
VAAGLLILAAACAAGTPYTYTPSDAGKEGPGLFSGEKGEFVLYRR